MKVSLELSKSLDLQKSLESAGLARNDFFPSTIGYRAARASTRFPEAVTRLLKRGYQPPASDVVEVPKWGGGTRPAADLPVIDRLLLDAFTSHLRPTIADGLVNWSLENQARADAEQYLVEGDHGYVLVTDVVSAYEYVNLEILANELLDLTGEDEATASLIELLLANSVTGKGIPQGAPQSAVLADVYLSIADRALLRQGFQVFRWADDYRIPAMSWSDALRAQLALERALRHELGMVINASKTWTPTTEKYGQWIEAQRSRQREREALVVEVLAAFAAGTDPYEYDGEEDADEQPPAPDPEMEAEFVELTADDVYWGPGPENYSRSNRVRTLLRSLAREGSSAPLDRLRILLQRFPHLTRDTASYLRRHIHGGWEADTIAAIDEAIQGHSYLVDWQLGWLLHAAVPAEEQLPETLVAAALRTLETTTVPWFARGRSAVLLGREQRLSVDPQLSAMLDAAPTATRPDLLAGAALVTGNGTVRQALLKAWERDPVLREVPGLVQDLNPFYL